KTIVTPVRGAGRQHGVFVIERLLDFAARELGLDRVEIRRRNLLGPEQFPHNHEIIFQDSAPLVYDSGNYEPALDEALRIIDYKGFVRDEQPRLRAAGRHVGIGVVCYVEGTGIGPYEGARVTAEPSARGRSRGSKPRRTSGPTAAARRTACTRCSSKWTRKRRWWRSSATWWCTTAAA